jgi:hypothetical protein
MFDKLSVRPRAGAGAALAERRAPAGERGALGLTGVVAGLISGYSFHLRRRVERRVESRPPPAYAP